MTLVAPSILDVKDEDLKNTIPNLTKLGADWIHVDVIDWKQTPSKRNYNIETLKDTKENRFYDLHLMVDNIKDYIDKYQSIADSITIHSKSPNLINYIKNLNKKAGVAINPNEQLEDYKHLLEHIDLLLFMTVYPGYGGQKFIQEVTEQIDKAINHRKQNNLDFQIQVDGGINQESFKFIKGKVDIGVAGSYIIKSDNKEQAIKSLKEV